MPGKFGYCNSKNVRSGGEASLGSLRMKRNWCRKENNSSMSLRSDTYPWAASLLTVPTQHKDGFVYIDKDLHAKCPNRASIGWGTLALSNSHRLPTNWLTLSCLWFLLLAMARGGWNLDIETRCMQEVVDAREVRILQQQKRKKWRRGRIGEVYVWNEIDAGKKTIAVCPFAATLIPEPQAF